MFFRKRKVYDVPCNGKSRVENAITSISSVQCTPVGMYQKNFGKRLAFNLSVGAFCLTKLEHVSITYICPVWCAHARNFGRQSANLSPYQTILVRRPLFNGCIINSRNQEIPYCTVLAAQVLTIISYYL